ncbi:MAG: hypothetical protein ACPGVG_17025 [Mycobacterium sp.]
MNLKDTMKEDKKQITDMHTRIDAIERSVETLTDGQWNRKDVSALFVIAGAIGGLASSALLAAQGMGWL